MLEGEAGELFERLRAWRSQAAQSASVPAYVVFTDATLQAIAETRPASLMELSRCPASARGSSISTARTSWPPSPAEPAADGLAARRRVRRDLR